MKPIMTLTLNPTIDAAAKTETVRPTHKVRTFDERYDPGGGGINVARVVNELGGRSLAVYLAGGLTGGVLDNMVKRAGVRHWTVPIAGLTRVSHVVHELSTGREFRFTPEGPEILEEEWRTCLEQLTMLDFDYLVASGSLPRGVPEDFYRTAAGIAKGKRAKFVLDTSGPALKAALGHGIHLDFGAEIRVRADFTLSRSSQAIRRETGMPRPVMMLMTLQATLVSVFCVGRVRA